VTSCDDLGDDISKYRVEEFHAISEQIVIVTGHPIPVANGLYSQRAAVDVPTYGSPVVDAWRYERLHQTVFGNEHGLQLRCCSATWVGGGRNGRQTKPLVGQIARVDEWRIIHTTSNSVPDGWDASTRTTWDDVSPRRSAYRSRTKSSSATAASRTTRARSSRSSRPRDRRARSADSPAAASRHNVDRLVYTNKWTGETSYPSELPSTTTLGLASSTFTSERQPVVPLDGWAFQLSQDTGASAPFAVESYDSWEQAEEAEERATAALRAGRAAQLAQIQPDMVLLLKGHQNPMANGAYRRTGNTTAAPDRDPDGAAGKMVRTRSSPRTLREDNEQAGCFENAVGFTLSYDWTAVPPVWKLKLPLGETSGCWGYCRSSLCSPLDDQLRLPIGERVWRFWRGAVAEAEAESAESLLPPGWAAAIDPSTGDEYYYDEEGHSSWTKPTGIPAGSAVRSGAADDGCPWQDRTLSLTQLSQQPLEGTEQAAIETHADAEAIAADQRGILSTGAAVCTEVSGKKIVLERLWLVSGEVEQRTFRQVGEYLRYPYFADETGLFFYRNIACGMWQLNDAFSPESEECASAVSTGGDLPFGEWPWKRHRDPDAKWSSGCGDGEETEVSTILSFQNDRRVRVHEVVSDRFGNLVEATSTDTVSLRPRTDTSQGNYPWMDEVACAMSPENRKAVEFIATSAIRTNEADRRLAIAGLRNPLVDLDQIISYLQSCPLVIHFPIDVLELFVNDTHYRNQFETARSRGTLDTSARTIWEASLFGDAYNDAEPFVRPKYGGEHASLAF
jgi:hypothetical protein